MREKSLNDYERYLQEQEKSRNTVEKYLRDARHFLNFLGEKELSREQVLAYKEHLQEHYKVSSANSMIIALNNYLRFIGKGECCVHIYRVQRQIFRDEERELDKEEYYRLVKTAMDCGNERLSHIIQTIGMTGIRIGELKFITVEALKKKVVEIDFKSKRRIIILPDSLRELLMRYCRSRKIESGCIFITKTGNAVDRRNVWAEMKRLCMKAGVKASKIFPHNLRHLFARCYYEKEKDIVRLADYLGHSSVETTRRYTMISSMEACLKELELGLLVTKKGAILSV